MFKKIGEWFRKLSYRYTIYICVFCVMAVLLLAFLLYNYYDYKRECLENAQRDAANTSTRIVNQVDERLENLAQYYMSIASNDDMQWVLENDLEYSDYDHYHSVMEDLASNSLFGDYIEGYALINFSTGWTLNSKGMYRLEEAVNQEELLALFQEDRGAAYKNYWFYNPAQSSTVKISREYRLTIETSGLNFIMRLPMVSSKIYAMLIANVDMNSWQNWIGSLKGDAEQVVVLDSDGNLIYATDASLSELSTNLRENSDILTSGAGDTDGYAVSFGKSDVLGWEYYVFLEYGQENMLGRRFSATFLVLMALLIVAAFMAFSQLIYLPVRSLVKNMADDPEKMKGNEFQYLAGKFATVMDDKKVLQEAVEQNQEKLQELFELRMLRGEVTSEDEWREYVENLGLRAWKHFATAVIVLNLREEETEQSGINEDVICLELVEKMPEHLKNLAWMVPVYNSCTIFAIFAEDTEERLLEQIKAFYYGMQDYATESTGFHVMMGVSANHTEFYHIWAAYRESINALTNMAAGNAETDCHFYLGSFTKNGEPYDSNFEEEIRRDIKAVDKDACYATTGDFIHYLEEQKNPTERLIYTFQYVNAILLAARETRIDIGEIFSDGIGKIYKDLMEVLEPDRERRYIKKNLIDPILEERSNLLEKRSYSMMDEIENLIAERKGNITQTECADALGVHPTYIWKILKMEKGKSFAEYLEDYKVEEAKHLLLKTDLSVAEIAAQLNYTNAQNFIRFFSKCTGVTPGKFRKLY